MGSGVDLSEFASAFVAEATENLEVAGQRLLAIEAAARTGGPQLRHVREVFRALHTIKGLAAMVGVEPIVVISHRMESILRTADRGGTGLTSAAVDLLVEGVRAIESRLQSVAGNREVADPPAALLDKLDALDVNDAEPVTKALTRTVTLDPAIAQKLSAAEHEHLERAVATGSNAFRAEFFPSPARAEQGLTINAIRERVVAIGEIVKVVPLSVPPSATAPGGLAFVLIIVTSGTREAIAAAVETTADAIISLTSDPAVTSAARSAEGDPQRPSLPMPDREAGVDEDLSSEPARRGVVRVDVARLDEAMDRLSSLVVSRFRLTHAAAALAERGVDVRELNGLLLEHARQLRDLRGAILHVRMVPISEVLDRVPIIVRSLRRSTGKPVRLEIDGGQAELDKAVAERLFPAIVHLVRNAVDHALETPDERRRRGKPEEGRVRVTCTQHSNARLVLSVQDDGRGIDREVVARRAGVDVPANDAGLLDLLCRPGLSTRDVISTTSGRGMGMDIIRRVAVDQLGGELLLESRWGEGTTFTMIVPLTISIIDAFIFECAGQRFAVPVAIVEEIVEIDPAALTSVTSASGGATLGMFFRRGESVPLMPLERVFRLGKERTGARKAIVVRRAGEPLAFAVDRMIAQQEVVVRPLEDPLVQAPGISGATDLGDGQPILVVDLVALGGVVRSVRGGAAA